MSKISLSTLAAALMMTGAAFAQTGTTGGATTGGSTSTTTTTTTITPQQETAIKTYVTKEKTRSISAPSGFTVTTGATVPQNVGLHTFGSDMGMTQYRYVVMNNRTVVVDPSTRKVIKIID